MKVNAEKSVSWAGGKALEIPLGNLVLLPDHPKGQNKIQYNCKSELFVVELKHQDPNVYIIKPLNGKGPMHMVNQKQLFDLHKSQGNDMPSSPAPDTKLPTILEYEHRFSRFSLTEYKLFLVTSFCCLQVSFIRSNVKCSHLQYYCDTYGSSGISGLLLLYR